MDIMIIILLFIGFDYTHSLEGRTEAWRRRSEIAYSRLLHRCVARAAVQGTKLRGAPRMGVNSFCVSCDAAMRTRGWRLHLYKVFPPPCLPVLGPPTLPGAWAWVLQDQGQARVSMSVKGQVRALGECLHSHSHIPIPEGVKH